MRFHRLNFCRFLGNAVSTHLVCGLLCLAAAADAAAAGPEKRVAKEPLTRAAVEALIDKHLRSNSNYLPGDMLTQTEVEPIFNELIDRGYQSPENEGLYDSFLPQRDPFVKTMRSPQGIAFMRAVSRLPNVYDRLERLSWSPTGRAILAQLMGSADGRKALEQMLSEDGVKVVEETLSKDPRGKNFQLPTGKIHTANELIEHLCELYVGKTAP